MVNLIYLPQLGRVHVHLHSLKPKYSAELFDQWHLQDHNTSLPSAGWEPSSIQPHRSILVYCVCHRLPAFAHHHFALDSVNRHDYSLCDDSAGKGAGEVQRQSLVVTVGIDPSLQRVIACKLGAIEKRRPGYRHG